MSVKVYTRPERTALTRNARIDTGAEKSCISSTLVDLLGYGGYIKHAPGETWTGANNDVKIEVTGKVQVFLSYTRYDTGEKSEKPTFLVVPNLPWDLLLGYGFINRAGILEKNKHILPIRLAPLTKEQRQRSKEENERVKEERRVAVEAEKSRKKEERERKQAELDRPAESTKSSKEKAAVIGLAI
jgi:hypothetical protein